MLCPSTNRSVMVFFQLYVIVGHCAILYSKMHHLLLPGSQILLSYRYAWLVFCCHCLQPTYNGPFWQNKVHIVKPEEWQWHNTQLCQPRDHNLHLVWDFFPLCTQVSFVLAVLLCLGTKIYLVRMRRSWVLHSNGFLNDIIVFLMLGNGSMRCKALLW